ncbi:unnamed protein product [Fusarium graminearum]|uniref:Uncharacterized protein n=1 Tax=Gibberella zeae TaxID=5518 RepID=A0A4E9ED62_GIBZA|nr:unnamed protein product [Fusarium graminearum]CAF3635109.1 unnamed protein product [Fusarium graminearum]CAG1973455.1 unnamed protein product [Fusarium graminearum]CAG1988968.1 unnamed protein product [Fusarium graminearum]
MSSVTELRYRLAMIVVQWKGYAAATSRIQRDWEKRVGDLPNSAPGHCAMYHGDCFNLLQWSDPRSLCSTLWFGMRAAN